MGEHLLQARYPSGKLLTIGLGAGKLAHEPVALAAQPLGLRIADALLLELLHHRSRDQRSLRTRRPLGAPGQATSAQIPPHRPLRHIESPGGGGHSQLVRVGHPRKGSAPGARLLVRAGPSDVLVSPP